MANSTRNQPITVQIQHDQVDTTSYDIEITDLGTSTVIVSDSKPVDPLGVNFPYPAGFAVGSYEIVVTAVGPGGSVESDPVQLVVAPGAPSQPVIVIVVG